MVRLEAVCSELRFEVGRATEYSQSKMVGASAGWRSNGPEWLPSQRRVAAVTNRRRLEGRLE